MAATKLDMSKACGSLRGADSRGELQRSVPGPHTWANGAGAGRTWPQELFDAVNALGRNHEVFWSDTPRCTFVVFQESGEAEIVDGRQLLEDGDGGAPQPLALAAAAYLQRGACFARGDPAEVCQRSPLDSSVTPSVTSVALKKISEPPGPPHCRPCCPVNTRGIFWNSASVTGDAVRRARRYW